MAVTTPTAKRGRPPAGRAALGPLGEVVARGVRGQGTSGTPGRAAAGQGEGRSWTWAATQGPGPTALVLSPPHSRSSPCSRGLRGLCAATRAPHPPSAVDRDPQGPASVRSPLRFGPMAFSMKRSVFRTLCWWLLRGLGPWPSECTVLFHADSHASPSVRLVHLLPLSPTQSTW